MTSITKTKTTTIKSGVAEDTTHRVYNDGVIPYDRIVHVCDTDAVAKWLYGRDSVSFSHLGSEILLHGWRCAICKSVIVKREEYEIATLTSIIKSR